MTSLSWKRKLSTNIQGKSAALFKSNEDNEDSVKDNDKEEDWTTLLPKKRCVLGNTAESARLMAEGIFLAEQQRYWEAINRFDEALGYKLDEAKLHEMKAQALLELNELCPAIEAAEKAVKAAPLWAEAYQTYGRTQISNGNIEIAIRSFCIALHLKPDFEDIYQEDLPWALDLRAKQKSMQQADTSDEKASINLGESCSCSKYVEEGREEQYIKLNIMEPS